MAAHVAGVAEEVGLLPLFVTADPEVATWAAGTGHPSIPDPGNGLDAAASAGVDWAGHTDSRWLVLHSDLPLLEVSELLAFWELGNAGDAIAPSSDGGTSAITALGPIEFSFGPGSFARHLNRLSDPAIVVRTGLLHDIDSPTDLTSARAHPRGSWIPG